MEKTWIDRIRGVAVGAAVGDALGMPLEFQPRRPVSDLVTDMVPGRLPAGTFTDDTEMALALAESILAYQIFDPADLSTRFVTWMHANPPDIGNHTWDVLRHMDTGSNWNQAAIDVQRANPSSAGNGSVMRCWPLALLGWHDINTLIRESITQSQITHTHTDCTAGSAFINVTIAYLIQGISREHAINQAIDSVEMASSLRDVILQAPSKSRMELTNSGWVRHTLESAVWGLLTTDNFESALVNVVNLGNDADTAGSVVGALAGATYGDASIPQRWRSKLIGEYPLGSGQLWHVDAFVKLAEQLCSTARELKFGE
jgi:ADP-ribosyl-[dinitrogen reductase] hydrolase